MSSAICFNLDKSKILSSGNGLIEFHLNSKLMKDPIYLTLAATETLCISHTFLFPIYTGHFSAKHNVDIE